MSVQFYLSLMLSKGYIWLIATNLTAPDIF